MSYAYRWKGDQMFYLLVKVSFAYLLPVSLKSLCFSVISTKRQFRLEIVSEYDQEIPQSQTADNPVAP